MSNLSIELKRCKLKSSSKPLLCLPRAQPLQSPSFHLVNDNILPKNPKISLG